MSAAAAATATQLEQHRAALTGHCYRMMVALLRQDATLSMPPYTLWLRGSETVRTWLRGRGSGCGGSRIVPIAAGGSPAVVQYRKTGDRPCRSRS
ncbi:MAG TPA: hypothetical protein VG389_16790 [Myxococcota bacterium]|jgi:RNA polymerase sigma-70 factor (ECF subfamily)|nr:hypothetical protein [Myxococcota bacterium]